MEVIESEDGELEADAYFELARINIIKGEKEKAINYANIAIETDAKKIAPKIKNDITFIPILAKVNIPFNIDNIEEKKMKLSKKEKKSKEHLEEMVDKTRKLSYNDINLLNRNGRKKQDVKSHIMNDTKEKQVE